MTTTMTEKQFERMLASARGNGVRAHRVVDEEGCMCAIGHVISAKRGRRLTLADARRIEDENPVEWQRWLDRLVGPVGDVYSPNDRYIGSLTDSRARNLRKGDPTEVARWADEMKRQGAYQVR